MPVVQVVESDFKRTGIISQLFMKLQAQIHPVIRAHAVGVALLTIILHLVKGCLVKRGWIGKRVGKGKGIGHITVQWQRNCVTGTVNSGSRYSDVFVDLVNPYYRNIVTAIVARKEFFTKIQFVEMQLRPGERVPDPACEFAGIFS